MGMAQETAAWLLKEPANIEFRIPAADLHESSTANLEKSGQKVGKIYFK